MHALPPNDLMCVLARDGTLLHVRRLTAADIPALQRFNCGLSEATRNVFLPHSYDDATLARCVARDQRGCDRAYVLLAGPDVVGYFFLWEFDRPVPSLGLGLADAWQGQGIGGRMLDRLIDDARNAGRAGVELTTVPATYALFHLYRRAGFAHVEDVDNIAGDGRVVREHRMFLALQPGAQPPLRQFKPPDDLVD